jgi:hypothetical protein
MKLLACGCSFTFGEELSDQFGTLIPSDIGFAGLLAKKLNLEYHCAAEPGSGADRTVRQLLKNLDSDVSLVVIGWSLINRFEFDFGPGIGWQNLIAADKWPKDYRSPVVLPYRKQFYANLTNLYMQYHYAKNVLFAEQILQQKNIPYIFCRIDPAFDRQQCDDPEFQEIMNLINWDHWFDWKDPWGKSVSFTNWADVNNYPLGPRHHPLDRAHSVTAELLYKFMINQQIEPRRSTQ